MVLLRELLNDILASVSGNDDDTWHIETSKSREQCHMLVNTPMPYGKIILLELRVISQDGGSEQILLVRLTQIW